jgi:MFS family permease
MLLLGLVMLVVRFTGYALAPNPGIVLVFQMLHGPTFAALWLAGVAYVAEIAPPGLGITAQGLFTGVFMGLGSALGALVGGFLFELVGFSQLFLVTAGGIFLAAVGFAFSLLKQRSPNL